MRRAEPRACRHRARTQRTWAVLSGCFSSAGACRAAVLTASAVTKATRAKEAGAMVAAVRVGVLGSALDISLYPSLATLSTPAKSPRNCLRNCLRRRSLWGHRRGTGPESPWTMSRASRSIMSRRSCVTKWTSRCFGGPATSSAAHSRWPTAPPRDLRGGGRTAYPRSATQWSRMSRRRAVSGIPSSCST